MPKTARDVLLEQIKKEFGREAIIVYKFEDRYIFSSPYVPTETKKILSDLVERIK